MVTIKRAHWNILADCNLTCGFCYLWRRDNVQIWETSNALNLIEALSTRISEIVFGGGDPLMRSDLLELVQFAKDKGLKVELHTNAQLIDDVDAPALFSLLDRLGLSLDGEDEATHDSMRAAHGNFQKCIAALELAERSSLSTTVRTLVTRRNVNRIGGIGSIVADYSCIQKWSLRQFVPLGRGAKTQKAYALSNKEFFIEAQSVLSSNYRLNMDRLLKMSIVSEDDMSDCFCLITEDGIFYGHPADRRYQAIGKFPEETIDTILQRVSYLKEQKRSLGESIKCLMENV